MEGFNARNELRQIRKAPREGQAEKVLQLKQNLANQLEGLAQVQEQVIEFVRRHSDSSAQEIFQQVTERGARFQMNDEQRNLAGEIIGEYVRLHKNVRSVRNKHPFDHELFTALFGKDPKGTVNIIEGPMTLYVRCSDPQDYALIYSGKFIQNAEIDQHDFDTANLSGGVSTYGSRIRGLEGTIIAENSSHLQTLEAQEQKEISERIHVHEEQHAMKRIFGGRTLSTLLQSRIMESFNNRREVPEIFKLQLRELRGLVADDRARDEILAYFKDGTNAQKIYDNLLHSELYSYLDEYVHAIYSANPDASPQGREVQGRFDMAHIYGKQLDSSVDLKDVQQNIVRDIFLDEYSQIIYDGIVACLSLRESGWSDDKVIGLLIHEPLPRWKKVVDRLLESTVD